MTVIILAALSILISKFLADLFVKIPGIGSLPLIGPIAHAGILYPVGLALFIWQILGDTRLAIGLLAGSIIFLLIAGVPLI